MPKTTPKTTTHRVKKIRFKQEVRDGKLFFNGKGALFSNVTAFKSDGTCVDTWYHRSKIVAPEEFLEKAATVLNTGNYWKMLVDYMARYARNPSSDYWSHNCNGRYPGDCKVKVLFLEFKDELKLKPLHEWDQQKLDIMRECHRRRAKEDSAFVKGLLESGEKELVEDTSHPFWGRGKEGKGQNWQGKLLMELRLDLQKKK